ncbi:MAG: Asp-tRNA(Asn)/Glu-tRNA(Gln) amidotransferase subunit GatA [Bdellovibrionales bacterium]|nr:Asp-tRNA(Asn)/Glu-tRNA(Gln) amidotransferase subunit GatA [Bdellovibrionales bacterium]
MEIAKASLKELTKAIKDKKISCEELTRHYLNEIGKQNSKINAYISLNEQAIDQAKELDLQISKHNLSDKKLLGIPFGIKDMICTKGLKTTAASKMLENFVPPYDATLVERIKNHGGIILGKLNQDEFAMGSSNENSYFGPCKNPWDLERVPGGSSGGSAAAQAAGLAAITIGTDTGGSIRQPSNFCNTVGVKPTYGRISRYGVVAFASSLDQAGPIASCTEDAALALEAICGVDEKDSTTAIEKVENFSENLAKDLKGLKIGIIKEFHADKIATSVQKVYQEALSNAKNLGAEIVEISIPMTQQSIPMYYLIAASEASSNLARYDGVRYGYRSEFPDLSGIELEKFYSRTRAEGFGAEVQRRIILGTYCLSSGYFDAYYKKACQVRRILKNQFNEEFKKCDVILSPVTTSPAFKLTEKINDPLSMYLNDIYTVSANLVGLPGMSLPYGFSENHLPIGVQLMAPAFQEKKMLNVAHALEQTTAATRKKAVL